MYKLVYFAKKPLRSVVPSAELTKRADLVLETLFFTNSFSLLKLAKIGALSAEVTKRADLGLKMLFCTNFSTLLKTAKNCFAQCENDKRF